MPAKIRLQRQGKKASAFFHIVIADGRAPRDGKFIEKIGTYNPTTNPATINLDNDKALAWLNKGAQVILGHPYFGNTYWILYILFIITLLVDIAVFRAVP